MFSRVGSSKEKFSLHVTIHSITSPQSEFFVTVKRGRKKKLQSIEISPNPEGITFAEQEFDFVITMYKKKQAYLDKGLEFKVALANGNAWGQTKVSLGQITNSGREMYRNVLDLKKCKVKAVITVSVEMTPYTQTMTKDAQQGLQSIRSVKKKNFGTFAGGDLREMDMYEDPLGATESYNPRKSRQVDQSAYNPRHGSCFEEMDEARNAAIGLNEVTGNARYSQPIDLLANPNQGRDETSSNPRIRQQAEEMPSLAKAQSEQRSANRAATEKNNRTTPQLSIDAPPINNRKSSNFDWSPSPSNAVNNRKGSNFDWSPSPTNAVNSRTSKNLDWSPSPTNAAMERKNSKFDWSPTNVIAEEDPHESYRQATRQENLPWNSQGVTGDLDLLHSQNRQARNMSLDVPWNEEAAIQNILDDISDVEQTETAGQDAYDSHESRDSDYLSDDPEDAKTVPVDTTDNSQFVKKMKDLPNESPNYREDCEDPPLEKSPPKEKKRPRHDSVEEVADEEAVKPPESKPVEEDMRSSLSLDEHITAATSKAGRVAAKAPEVSHVEETPKPKEPSSSESEDSDDEFIHIPSEKLVSSLPPTVMEEAKPNEKSQNELDSWIGHHGAGESGRQPCCASCILF